jgi:competence protein ComEA
VAIGAGQLAVVGLALLIGLVVTTWWLVRADPHEVRAPAATVTTAAPLVTGLPATGAAAPVVSGATTELVVDVAGKVRRPGIAVLAPGSRVVDALEAAGGVRPGVDLTALNLARALVDGEQILVGVRPAAGVAAGAVADPSAPGAAGALVPLNSADQAELESLPEVGPVTAAAIIAWRDAHGGFTAVDELLEVDGIGEATLGQLAPLVTL